MVVSKWGKIGFAPGFLFDENIKPFFQSDEPGADFFIRQVEPFDTMDLPAKRIPVGRHGPGKPGFNSFDNMLGVRQCYR